MEEQIDCGAMAFSPFRAIECARNGQADEVAEIKSVPAACGGRKPEHEHDRLSNILKVFNDQFGNIEWTDEDRVKAA